LAKRGREKATLDATAASLGAALGHVAARLDRWRQDRTAIAAELQRLLDKAHGMLGGLEIGELVSAPPPPKNKRTGGRPKGYKMSESTKAKLRAAWKKRQAAMKNVKAGASAAKAGAKAFVRGQARKPTADGSEHPNG
jgi:hypothetical protein